MQVSHADKTWFLAIKNVSSNAADSWAPPYLAMIDGNPTGAGVDRSIGKRAASPVLVGKEEGGSLRKKDVPSRSQPPYIPASFNNPTGFFFFPCSGWMQASSTQDTLGRSGHNLKATHVEDLTDLPFN